MYSEESDFVSNSYIEAGKQLKNLFKQFFSDGIYAMDWDHECFYIDDFSKFPAFDEDGAWIPNFLPDGETVFFLSTNLTEGWIADFNNKSIILVGESFIQAVKELKLDFLDF